MVQALVRARKWERIGRREWGELRAEFPESAIRPAIHELGLPLEQPFAGIVTKTIDELESSLTEMADVYANNPAARRECRDAVIAAKNKARFASRNDNAALEKRALKAEMVEWMLVWLGDPAMFATWATLRKRAGYCSSTAST